MNVHRILLTCFILLFSFPTHASKDDLQSESVGAKAQRHFKEIVVDSGMKRPTQFWILSHFASDFVYAAVKNSTGSPWADLLNIPRYVFLAKAIQKSWLKDENGNNEQKFPKKMDRYALYGHTLADITANLAEISQFTALASGSYVVGGACLLYLGGRLYLEYRKFENPKKD
ncbi:hypothetical protein [Candidatus Nucleicultrix amoebiphila]|jgi:hypothetical protein|uniref:Uncharacterized protein n=1 Tax=Candidatus Nucleicultrix amoebiphila FS5 TaxID=1414854 RepID=A0A1W6N4E5_9PROT|nr:hypothetical protein [Candidatus Nucleicultrix amoebiphila]ARN84725.1 hypothetical protein GQ61_04775 [Candidatus Nucleicultrix amoebiphila FS5]